MSRLPSLFVGTLLFLAAPRLAHAADDATTPPAFGHFGQFALQLSDGLTVNAADLIAGPELEASFFVSPHVSLGVMAGVNWLSENSIGSTSSMKEFAVRVGPRVGYDFALSDLVSFWPQIGVDYRSSYQSSSIITSLSSTADITTTHSTTSAFAIVVVAPFIIHPTRGFFVGAGPSLYTEVSDSTSANGASTDNSKVTSIGLMATIGGAI